MIQLIKNIWGLGCLTIIAFTLTLLLFPFIFFRNTRIPPYLNRIFGKPGTKFTNTYLFGTKMQVIGKENIPPSSVNYASVSNHLSFFDIGVLMAELSSMFIMKRAILYFPFYGWMAYIFGSISINRYSLKNLNAVAEKMVAFVRLGGKLHLFPEGTRSRDGNLLPFKKGLLHKLYNENLPVLCCALWNTQRAFPADNYNLIKMKFNIPVYLSVGRLLRPTEFASFENFFNTCCQEVEQQLNTLKTLHGSAS